MKRIIKIFILSLLFIFYKIANAIFPKKETVALMYHSVNSDSGSLAVSPAKFEKQLVYLKDNNWQFLTVKKLLEREGNQSIDQKTALLTFDDGYKDFIATALPILKKYGAPATLFIHANRSSDNLDNNFSLMDWDEIRTANQDGIEIGNHSHSHPDMKILNLEELELEIKNSEVVFKKELGYAPKVFAYPGGKYNNKVAEALKDNGYDAVFTMDEGVITAGDDPLKFKRTGINGNISMFEFRIILTRAFNWYQILRKLFRLKK